MRWLYDVYEPIEDIETLRAALNADSSLDSSFVSKDLRGKIPEILKEIQGDYSVEKIVKGINPREGEIEKVINETEELARQNDKEESIEQDRQTQADE